MFGELFRLLMKGQSKIEKILGHIWRKDQEAKIVYVFFKFIASFSHFFVVFS